MRKRRPESAVDRGQGFSAGLLRRFACPGPSPSDGRAAGGSNRPSAIRRPPRLRDTSRTPPLGSPPRGLAGPLPRVPSGLLARRPRFESTSRQAFVRETPNPCGQLGSQSIARRRGSNPVALAESPIHGTRPGDARLRISLLSLASTGHCCAGDRRLPAPVGR